MRAQEPASQPLVCSLDGRQLESIIVSQPAGRPAHLARGAHLAGRQCRQSIARARAQRAVNLAEPARLSSGLSVHLAGRVGGCRPPIRRPSASSGRQSVWAPAECRLSATSPSQSSTTTSTQSPTQSEPSAREQVWGSKRETKQK